MFHLFNISFINPSDKEVVSGGLVSGGSTHECNAKFGLAQSVRLPPLKYGSFTPNWRPILARKIRWAITKLIAMLRCSLSQLNGSIMMLLKLQDVGERCANLMGAGAHRPHLFSLPDEYKYR